LLVVMHNVQSNLSNTKRDFITAINRTSELELKLAMQDFELMVANSSVETLTKQLSKAKSFINRLNIELTTETSQNKSLMHKILSLEREIREAEDNNLIPF
jgi:predicted  nucleic acid-binding Zn-ribbon protein